MATNYGLCSEHFFPSPELCEMRSSVFIDKRNCCVTRAGEFLKEFAFDPFVYPVVEKLPFIVDEAEFLVPMDELPHLENNVWEPNPKQQLELRHSLYEASKSRHNINKPIVFLVVTNIPHTSLYILNAGRLYSVGFGYINSEGAMYSIDIPLDCFSEARIVWIGVLTETIAKRLQEDLRKVRKVTYDVDLTPCPPDYYKVNRHMIFHLPSKPYGGPAADSNPAQWNCTKWAMHILFGDRKPANFRELVSRTNPGLSQDQLKRMLIAYKGKVDHEFIKVLHEINDASFPRDMSGGRRRITNNRNNVKGGARSNRPLSKKNTKIKTRKNKKNGRRTK
jgi:hypothetical protein